MKIKLSRRTFLAAAASAALGAGACTKSNTPYVTDEKWVSAACWHNCGGHCVNKALVSNGVVIRQKTDDTHRDSLYYPQQRGCVRGRAQRRQVYAPDRLKYPMKRVHWEPVTGGDRTLRGSDKWVRISWDEALDHVVSEIKRIKRDHGNRSFLLHSWTEHSEYKRVFGLYGGFIEGWGTCSYGNWTLTPQNIGFGHSGGYMTCNDRLDLLNCETIVMFGVNSAWSAAGMAPNAFLAARRAGVRFIAVDPFYNDTYAMLDADWIPVNPGSDTAFLLGVTHTLITQDSLTKPLIDWEFLNKATIGFDSISMPEGEDIKGNFKDYVLGVTDGIPKDGKWASERCGAPEEQIIEMAHIIGVKNRVALLTAWAAARANNSDSFPQLLMTVGAMTGHMGKSGHMTGVCCHKQAANHGEHLVMPGRSNLPRIQNPVDDYINDVQVWDAVLGKPYNYTGNGSHGVECKPCEMRTADIRMMFHGSGNKLESAPDMYKGIEAHKKVEFVVCATTFFTASAKYSDIILPVNTEWEREGDVNWANREMITMTRKVIESLYESKEDQWIAVEIGKRLGLKEKDIYPFDRKQQLFNKAAGARVISEKGIGGGYEPLCTVTKEDLARWGVVGATQEGKIPLKELEDKGVYQVERSKGDPYGYIAFEEFRNNPEAHPRKFSESGRLEIHSRQFADRLNAMNYGKIEPIPTYIPPAQGYEATFRDWKQKIKGALPYQLISIRYIKRTHTVLDNVAVLSEAFHSPVILSTADAENEGISTGNAVLIQSKTGRSVRTALVSARVKPGTVVLLHGSRAEYDNRTGLAYGGDNLLYNAELTGQGTTGFNSLIVSVKKYSNKNLPLDADKPLHLPPMDQ